jgi:hypothetical protein
MRNADFKNPHRVDKITKMIHDYEKQTKGDIL